MIVSRFSLLLLSATLLVCRTQLFANEPIATNGEKLTLSAAIAEAIEHSPASRVVDAEIDSARGEVQTAGLRPSPELTFAPALKRVREGDSIHHEFKGTLALSRTFAFPGKQELLVAIAERNVELRRLGLEGLRMQLTVAVRQAFAELVAAQASVGLRQQQVESAQTFQHAATARTAAGYASDFEAVKSQGEVINAQRLLFAAQHRIAAARVELNGLLGREPLAPLEASGTLDDAPPARPLPELVALALAANPSLRLQAMQADLAGLNVRKARLARKPEFTVGPSLEYSRSEQVLGLSATVPLPSRNYGQGEILTATAEARKVGAETEVLRREIIRAVARAATQLAGARAQLALYSPAYLEQLKAVVAQAEAGYGQNATSLLLYLDAKHTYFDTLAGYQEALAEVITARAALESAVGVPVS